MSNLATLFGGGGSVEIGETFLQIEAGTVISGTTGTVALRCGGLPQSVSTYPIAALCETAKVTGNPITLPESAGITDVATDGAGNFVVTYDDSTYVLVSNDYGAAWNAVAHNLGSSAITVAWSGTSAGTFVVGGITSTVSVSTNSGVSFTAHASSLIAGIESLAIGGGNNQFVAAMVVDIDSIWGIRFYYSTNGYTYTAGTGFTTDSITASGDICVVWNQTLGMWIGITGATGAVDYYTSTDGEAWTGQVISSSGLPAPSNLNAKRALCCNGVQWLYCNSSEYATSTNGTSWVVQSNPTQYSLETFTWANGSYFYLSLQQGNSFLWTTDGVTLTNRWLYGPITGSAVTAVFGTGEHVIAFSGFAENDSTNAYYSATWPLADYVGLSPGVPLDDTAGGDGYSAILKYNVPYIRVQ